MRQPFHFYLSLLCYALQQTHHTLLHFDAWTMTVGEPDKGNEQFFVVRNDVADQLLVVAVGLTDLSFYPVAVDGMLETLLRHTDKNLYRGMPLLPFCL